MRADALGLPITIDVEGARVVIIGDDDDERARKLSLLKDAGADVMLVAADDFDDDLVDGAKLVMLTNRDAALAAHVSSAARSAGALVWCSDEPEHCDFAMPAIARLGQAQIATATGGSAPALASRLRAEFEAQLGDRFAAFVAELAKLREAVQRDEPDQEIRRTRLNAALDGFQLVLRVQYPEWLK
jgi:precorrin-2 dehydrogenase / sirohydrochlorin ferrochelatase